MPRKTETNYRLQIQRRMERLGTYKEEYEGAIEILARLQRQYDALDKKFEGDGYPFEVETAQGTKKAPIVTTLESLRKDILSYMNALGLTPKMGMQIDAPAKDAQKKKSPLAAALEQLSDSS